MRSPGPHVGLHVLLTRENGGAASATPGGEELKADPTSLLLAAHRGCGCVGTEDTSRLRGVKILEKEAARGRALGKGHGLDRTCGR